jgi:hypothetical protein
MDLSPDPDFEEFALDCWLFPLPSAQPLSGASSSSGSPMDRPE